jgi:predicted nucleotidyltransferase
MDRAEVIRTLERELAKAPDDLVAAWLFGSVARGDHGLRSDVDIALLYRTDPPHILGSPPAQLEEHLERVLGLPVEVVVQNHAPVDLIKRVLRDGILLLERDRSARVQFEVKSRNEYWDLLPILERYRGIRK